MIPTPRTASRARRAFSALAAIVLMSLWTAACGDGGATEPAPPPNRAPAASGSPPALTVTVGQTGDVNVAGYFTDPDGDALTYLASSSNAATVSVSVAGSVATVTAAARGEVTITVTARDPGGLSAQLTFMVTVPNQAPVAAGAVPAQTLFIEDMASVDVSAHFSDPDGDALTYSATSSETAVVSASVDGSVVSVGAVAQGEASVTVTATDPDGLSAQLAFAVTVPNRAPAADGAIPALTLIAWDTLSVDVSGHFTDPDGDALTYAASSSNAAVVSAVVSGSEIAMAAQSPGTAIVTITASDPGGLSGQLSFQVTVRRPEPVVIARIEPAVLVEGAAATITGTGFAPAAAQNQVLVGGIAASVTSAVTSVGATSLSIIVPHGDCLPPRRTELRVVVGSQSDARTVGVTPRSREDLDLPAGWYRYTYAGNGCMHLPGGEYLIGVVSTSEDPSSLTSVEMTSAPGDATVVANAASAARARPRVWRDAVAEAFPSGFSPTLAPTPRAFDRTRRRGDAGGRRVPGAAEVAPGEDAAGLRRDRELHAGMMARNMELVRRLGRPPAPPTRARSRTVTQGDTVNLYASSDRSCSAGYQVRALVRLTGNYTVWLDDHANPAGGFTNSDLAGLDAFYASHVRPIHDAYYGALSDVDGDGKLWILMTKEVNRAGFIGWTWFGDLYPSASCATSNQREIVFGAVPDPAGAVGRARTKQATLDFYPQLLTSQVTHLVQGNAVVFGSAQRATWEIQGGATLAEQLVAYRLFVHGSGREMGYAEYERGRAWYRDWVLGLARFFGWDSDAGSGRVPYAPERCSWVGTPEEGNSGPCKVPSRAASDVPATVYRYALDRWGGGYPGGETALMRRLTQSPHRGFAALQDASSWRIEHILADFYLALWLDLNGRRDAGMTTWNLQDIWSRFVRDAQLIPQTSSSIRFERRWSIRAGSSSYLHWTPTGSRAPAAIKVTSAGGGAVSSNISVWAYRIR